MRILVTGGSGLVGKSLCKKLFSSKDIEFWAPTHLELDVTDFTNSFNKIVDYSPDLIIHLAAMTDVDMCEVEKEQCYITNVLGTWMVVSAARKCDARLLYLSSDYVFSGNKNAPYFEYDKPEPINYYGLTKMYGERIVISHLKDYYIVRTAWLFGEGGDNFVTKIIENVKKFGKVSVVIDQRGSPTYVEDLVQHMFNLIKRDIFGIFHIVNEGVASWYELAVRAIEIAKIEGGIIPITSQDINTRAMRPRFSALSNINYRTIFGQRLRNWKSALHAFLGT